MKNEAWEKFATVADLVTLFGLKFWLSSQRPILVVSLRQLSFDSEFSKAQSWEHQMESRVASVKRSVDRVAD